MNLWMQPSPTLKLFIVLNENQRQQIIKIWEKNGQRITHIVEKFQWRRRRRLIMTSLEEERWRTTMTKAEEQRARMNEDDEEWIRCVATKMDEDWAWAMSAIDQAASAASASFGHWASLLNLLAASFGSLAVDEISSYDIWAAGLAGSESWFAGSELSPDSLFFDLFFVNG